MAKPGYNIVPKNGYVVLQHEAGYTVALDEQRAVFIELDEACERIGSRKVLVSGPDTHVDLSTFDLFELGQQIAQLGLQVAILENDDASQMARSFLETVTFNRSRPLRFFGTEEEAMAWLEVD